MFQILRDLLGKRTHALNTVYINPRALLHNFEYLQELHPTSTIFPVIKSNAYGHGIKEIATILKDIPQTYLCVDSYPEYKIAAKYNKHNYLVLSDTNPENYRLYNRKRSAFVVSSFATLEYFINKKRDVRIHIFINTGLNREGFDMSDLPQVIALLKEAAHINVEGVMSHLSHGDSEDYSFTQKQVDLFKVMYNVFTEAGFSPRFRHIGASAGAFTIQDDFFTAWRTGKSMYGYSPLSPAHTQYKQTMALKPCASISSTVLTLRTLQAGATVGYGGTREAKSEEHIALIPFGYYEGLSRGLSNQRYVKRKNITLPVIGTISMNYHTISTLGHDIQIGDQVEVFSANIGDTNSVPSAANLLHTNDYEIMIRRNEKIKRKIEDKG